MGRWLPPWLCCTCDPPCNCCSWQTKQIVNGVCTCTPNSLVCSDGRVIGPFPDCDCEPPNCDSWTEADCQNLGMTKNPDPASTQCCVTVPLPPVTCSACCPIGEESGSCTPRMMMIQIPNATNNPDPNIKCPSGPEGDWEACVGGVFTKAKNVKSCANGGTYYLICNRSKYFSWTQSLSPSGCDGEYHETINAPGGVSECCSWTFCKPFVAGNLFSQPFCPPGPPGCEFLSGYRVNEWCYGYGIGVRLLQDADGYYFSVSILMSGNCNGTGIPCRGTTGQWPPAASADQTINGTIAIIGRSVSEPRPLNCFAARTIPLTHWGARNYWDANDPPEPNLLLPMPPSDPQGAYGICSGTSSPVRPACLFPAGQFVTIQGLA